MLMWLTKEPYTDIRQKTQEILAKQMADLTIQRFCVTSDPDWLTRAIKQDDDPSQVTVIGAGVAFEFELTAVADGKLQDLSGVLTWVGYDLNSPNKHQTVVRPSRHTRPVWRKWGFKRPHLFTITIL